MKLFKCAAALVLAVMVLTVPALAIDLKPDSDDAYYVQDTANVLSSATEAAIGEYNDVLEAYCDSAQLVVVTVSYLPGEDSDVAATQLMNDRGVGSAEQSNGMLLLLVANEYRGWLAVGDGLDEVFTDRMVDQYLDDYFWDYIDNDEFDEGVRALTEHLYQWYLEYYNVSENMAAADEFPAPGTASAPAVQTRKGGNTMGGLILAIIVIVLVIWLANSNRRYRRMRGWGYTGGYWPVFWFGGRRMYNDWYRRQPAPPRTPRAPRAPRAPQAPRAPRTPNPGPGPNSFGGPVSRPAPSSRPSAPRSNGPSSRPSAPRSGGGRPSSPSRPGGGFSGGGRSGGGFGGHSGGGGGGRR